MHLIDQRFPCLIPDRIVMGLAQSVFATLFPSGTPRLACFTRVYEVPGSDVWANRLWQNTIAALAMGNPALAKAVLSKGLKARECEIAFEENWRGFLMAAGYPTAAIDFSNGVLFALIILKDTVLIEQVKSQRGGKPGGWGLVSALVDELDLWAGANAITTLRTSATNERSAKLFERHGFHEMKTDLLSDPVNFRKILVRDVVHKGTE